VSTNFQFDPKDVLPQSEVEVTRDGADSAAPDQFTSAASDEAQISAARRSAMERSRTLNAPGAPYGFDFDESYYRDFAGPETSYWDARRWIHVAYLLQTPILKQFRYMIGNKYNPRTAEYVWDDGTLCIALADVKAAVLARIGELKLSQVNIWEYLATPHSIAEGRAFDDLSFDAKMQRFRARA
jgi:hypothetical protein